MLSPPRSVSVSAAQRTIAVVGDTWSLRILRTIFRGKRRYGDFVQAFGVSRSVLTDRLAKLVEHGVLKRDSTDGRHPQYRLTEAGLDLWTLFLAMWLWETDWGTAQDPDTWAPDLPRARISHRDCGHAMRPQLRCTHCQSQVLPFDTRAETNETTNLPDTDTLKVPLSAFRRTRQTHSSGDDPAPPSQRLVRVVGDRWNSAVVAAAFRGTRLFSKFQDELQIGPTQLSARLAELQQLDILRAHAYAGSRQEYRLTRAGIALFPITLEMMRWGKRWLMDGQDALFVRHLPCDHMLVATWHCDHCARALSRDSVSFS